MLHHTLLCSSNATHAVASSSSPPDNSDKGAKPKKNNKSKKKSSKGNAQSSLPQVSYVDGDSSNHTKRRPDMSVFSERLLLLLHTLFSLSTTSSDSSFRTKCEHHLKDDWFPQPLILQCCMETKISFQNKLVSCISL